MIPAQQRLAAADTIVAEIDDRLVFDLELAVPERLAQVLLKLAARMHQRIHHRLEEAIGAAALRLGAVKREIGALEELIGVMTVIGRYRNPDAGADLDVVTIQIIGLADRRQDGGC